MTSSDVEQAADALLRAGKRPTVEKIRAIIGSGSPEERLEVRSHVLTLREGEMEARIQDRDRTISELREQLALLTGLLKKEQATRDVVARRLSTVEAELSAVRQVKTPVRASGVARRKTALKSVRRVRKPAAKRQRSTTPRNRRQRNR